MTRAFFDQSNIWLSGPLVSQGNDFKGVISKVSDTRDPLELNIALIEKKLSSCIRWSYKASNATNRTFLTFIVSEKKWRKFCNFSQKTSKNETEIIGAKV